MKNNYDVGVIDFGWGDNYGSLLNGYATRKVLNNLGVSVLTIMKPGESENEARLKKTHNYKFVIDHYNEDITPFLPLARMNELNEICENFISASDQIFNPYFNGGRTGYSFYLDFVNDDKRKISFASSFGFNYIKSNEKIKIITGLLKRFSAISVREKSSKDILLNTYGIDSTIVMEPAFIINNTDWNNLALFSEKNELDKDNSFILNYILDPSEEKRNAILYYSDLLKLKTINILNGKISTWEKNKMLLNLEGTLSNVHAEDLLKAFMNASFIITDSFHGMVFSIIFKKPFIVIANRARGIARFGDVLKKYDLMDRLIADENNIDLDEKYLNKINFDKSIELIEIQKEKTIAWLINALSSPINKTSLFIQGSKSMKLHPAIERCHVLVALIKEYGIKHIVISSGTRNVSIVRLFEAENYFKTYIIADERSAAYFALGLATKLKETVALCCTSGTAASNYVPAVTEAFYQKVPLLVITADRHPAFQGHMEDQKIIQYGLFNTICKKCVTLPVNDDRVGMWETRISICDAILAINHHGKGPVQINVPIEYIQRSSPPLEELKLLPQKKVKRFTHEATEDEWIICLEKLQNSKKIMIICGQRTPMSDKENAIINSFASKFDSIILVDHLANLHGDRVLHFSNFLSKINQNVFDDIYSPDLIITFGGKLLMNSEITGKLKNCTKELELWRVAEDGEVSDFFRCLSNIFECSDNFFINKLLKMSNKKINNNEYFDLWKKGINNTSLDENDVYKSQYTIRKTIMNIPERSLIHLGVGRTFIYSRYTAIKKDVEIFCNMGVNGIDGCASSFMGQVAATEEDRLCFLLIGDLSFFYDMNSLWNKKISNNIRILLNNDSGSNLLRHLNSPGITQHHATTAEGWVKSLRFKYISSVSKEEFEEKLPIFLSKDINEPIFFEVFT